MVSLQLRGFQFRFAFETKPLLVLRELQKMPEKGRPHKHVRKLLAAQHSRYQDQTAGLLMSSAHVMAHAARALRPLDDDAVAELMDASASPTFVGRGMAMCRPRHGSYVPAAAWLCVGCGMAPDPPQHPTHTN